MKFTPKKPTECTLRSLAPGDVFVFVTGEGPFMKLDSTWMQDAVRLSDGQIFTISHEHKVRAIDGAFVEGYSP